MTNLQQQYYWQQQRRRQLLNYRHFMDMQQAAQGAGGAEDQKEPIYPNDKLRIVVQTTSDSQLMSNGLFAVGEEPGYTKTGIYSAQRDDESKPITIDWGDGVVEEVDGDVYQKVHKYAKAGKYMVVVENIKTYAASSYNNSNWYNTTSQNAYTLKKVVSMPESMTSIGDDAFNGCSSLSSIQLPASLTSISQYAFQYCTSLSSIQIPDSVTSIGNYAFWDCTSLSSIQIPDSVTSIGNYAFSNCNNLTAFTVDEDNQNYKSDNNLLLTKDRKTLVVGVNGNVIVPASVTNIGYGAFYGCTSLSSITIPDSVTSIGNNAFTSCSSLSSIQIPESVTSIGSSAFYNCSSLSSIMIPNSVTSIGGNAFNTCSSLSNITCNRMTAPTVQKNTFGTSTANYTGRNTYDQDINRLYIPTGATGYDASYWVSTLQNPDKCGFTIEYI